jgi:DNA adenine methylase
VARTAPGAGILVHQFTPRLRAVYGALGYQLRLLDAPRRINCTGDRTPAREVLAVRNL